MELFYFYTQEKSEVSWKHTPPRQKKREKKNQNKGLCFVFPVDF